MRKHLGPAVALLLSVTAANAAPEVADLAALVWIAPVAGGKVMNACGDAVEPSLTPIDFGGVLGVAQLLVIPGGPTQWTCYGDTPGDMYLFADGGDGFRPVFHGSGYIIVMPGAQDGVHGFALGGPGFTFPVHVWTGAQFEPKGEISDADLSAMGSLPTYP